MKSLSYNKKIRIKNKFRFILSICIMLSFLYPVIMYAIDKNNVELVDISMSKIYVEKGDTLWAIAERNLPPRTDVRNFINEIKELNNLESVLIREGDIILVPYRIQRKIN